MSDIRRRILDASVAMVAEEGVRAVSFRAVARRAGVSHQAPYHLFGDYREILAEVAREGFRELREAMGRASATTTDPFDALAAAGVAYLNFATSHVGHFRVMFQPSLRGGAEVPLPEADATFDLLTHLAATAMAASSRRDLDPGLVALMSWSTVHGLAVIAVEGVVSADRDGDGSSIPPVDVVPALAALLR